MRAYLDNWPGLALYVEREGAGSLIVHGEGAVYGIERYVLPETAIELITPDQAREAVVEEVRTALAGVSMSKTARAAVAAALDDLIGDEA